MKRLLRALHRPEVLGLVALTLATLGLQFSYSEPGLLFVGPFLVLIALLMFGLYPGEALLLRIASPRPRRRRAPGKLHLPRSRRHLWPRGGDLLASSLAGRGPPL